MINERFYPNGLKVIIERVSHNEFYFTVLKSSKYHWLWGERYNQVTNTECVILNQDNEERSSCSLRVCYLGRIQTIPMSIKNINNFSLIDYCDEIVKKYLDHKEKTATLSEKVDSLIEKSFY